MGYHQNNYDEYILDMFILGFTFLCTIILDSIHQEVKIIPCKMQTHRNVRFHISKVTLSWYVYLKNGVLHVVKLLNIPMCFTHIHCAES